MIKFSFRYNLLTGDPLVGTYTCAKRAIINEITRNMGAETAVEVNAANPLEQIFATTIPLEAAKPLIQLLLDLGIYGYHITTDTMAEMDALMNLANAAVAQGKLIGQECKELPPEPAQLKLAEEGEVAYSAKDAMADSEAGETAGTN